MLSADQQHVYYVFWSRGQVSHLTLHRYSLVGRRLSSSVTLTDVGHGKVHTHAEIVKLILLPGGQLLVVGGDAVHFLNHSHK